jgi:hypothetical protein
MKKTILLALIGFSAFSCAKERTCSCNGSTTTTNATVLGSTNSTSTSTTKTTKAHTTKRNLRTSEECIDGTSTQVSVNLGITTTTVKTISGCEIN